MIIKFNIKIMYIIEKLKERINLYNFSIAKISVTMTFKRGPSDRRF